MYIIDCMCLFTLLNTLIARVKLCFTSKGWAPFHIHSWIMLHGDVFTADNQDMFVQVGSPYHRGNPQNLLAQ
jgi:hypothetical protein